jgi:hypothetical protein
MAAPAYRKAFKDFLKSRPGLGELPAMEQEFYIGSARPAVILQASLVEDTLRRAIQTKFVQDMSSDLEERIFESNGPLSTFGNKIIIGRALGLYKSVFHHDFEIIRELRNAFAHERYPMEFETPEVSGMCQHLRLADHPKLRQQPPIYSEKYPDKGIVINRSHPRTRFTAACYTITVHLLMSRNQLASGMIYELP